MSDDRVLRAVASSREGLHVVVHRAETRLEEMVQERKKLEERLKEQENIVEEAKRVWRQYDKEASEWMRSNRTLPPGSSYPIREDIGIYSKGRGYSVPRHYPWQATLPSAPAPAIGRKRRVINDDDSSDEEGVVVTKERTWKQRDLELRQNAIELESCVDEVFRKFNVSIRHV